MLPSWFGPVGGYEHVGRGVEPDSFDDPRSASLQSPSRNGFAGYDSSPAIGSNGSWKAASLDGSTLKHRSRAPAIQSAQRRPMVQEKRQDPFPDYSEDVARFCTDIPCLVMLVVFTVMLIAIGVLVWMLGNPARLTAGWDFRAQFCGIDAEVQALPFLYWPLPGELGAGHCVKECPSFEDLENGTQISVLRPEPLLVQDNDPAHLHRVLFSQGVRMQQVATYPTIPAVGRFCLPAPKTKLPFRSNLTRSTGNRRLDQAGSSGAQGEPAGPGNSAVEARTSMLLDVRDKFGSITYQLQRGVGSLWSIRWRVVKLAILLPFFLGATLAGLACCLPDVAFWLVVLGVSIGSLMLGCFVLVGASFRRGTDDFIVPTLDSLQLFLDWSIGGGLVILSIVVFCICFASRHLLQWCAACMRTTSGVLRSAGLCLPLICISLLVACLQSCVGFFWIWLLSAAVSSATIDWPAELPSMEGDATSIFNKVHGSLDDESEIVPGGPLVRGIRRVLVFRWPPALVIGLSILTLHLVCTFLACLGRYLVSSVISRWYFFGTSQQRQKRQRGVFCRSCSELIGSHVGSTVAGMLRMSFVPVGLLCVSSALLHKRLAPWRNRRGCARKIGDCCGSLCVCMSSAPYAEIALRACHFHEGVAMAAAGLPQATPALQFLFGLPVLFQVAVATLSSLVTAASILVSVQRQEHKTLGYVEIELGIALAGALLSSAPASAWASIYAASFDALCVCFMIDDSQRDVFKPPAKKLPLRDNGEVDADPTSHGLWSSGYTPPHFRALLVQADQMLQNMGRGGENLRAPEGYAAVADSSGSDEDVDSS